jgi:hypothetical protein
MAVFGESYRRDMWDVPGFIAPLRPLNYAWD